MGERSTSDDEIKPITITVPAAGQSYQPGARLLAVLAYPPLSETDSRWRRAERALGRLMWAGRAQDEAGALDALETVIPSHLLVSEDEMLREDKALRRQLDLRMGAAHVAIPYFRAAAQLHSGRTRTLDGWIGHLHEQEAERVETLARRGITVEARFPENRDNFETRVVRGSLPVIHLAVAIALAIDASQKAYRGLPEAQAEGLPVDVAGPQISIGDILVRPDLARAIIADAVELESFLPILNQRKPSPIVQLRCE